MLEVQAAIGRIQLKHMAQWTEKRTSNARVIFSAFEGFDAVRVPQFKCNRVCANDCACASNCKHAYYKAYVYVSPDKLKAGWSRDRIIDELNALGVPCSQGGCSEVYLEKAFDGTDFRPSERLPIAKALGENSLILLVHPTLTDANLQTTKDAIKKVLSSATA
jgi:dTDP-4-amino-4,6-dideoxygalactose transaminase